MMNLSFLSETRFLSAGTAFLSIGTVGAMIAGQSAGATIMASLAATLSIAMIYTGRRSTEPVAEAAKVCQEVAKGNFEARVLGQVQPGDMGVLQTSLNDLIDRCDAFVRESSAAMNAVCHNRYYRHIRLEGLHGSLKIAAETINAAMDAVRDRVAAFDITTTEFQNSVVTIIEELSTASQSMDHSAEELTAGANATREMITTVAAASEETTVNMQTVAAATTELTNTAAEISNQVQRSSEIALQAVNKAASANQTVQALREAADHIGDVVKLITAIAEQTNLLALNATIEAARAGEAGRGFAVVAQEVKALAGQTAKATQEISQHIEGVQGSTHEAAEAIEGIGAIISEVSNLTSHVVSAITAQTQATTEIAQNVEQAFTGMRDITGNVHGVTQNARATADIASNTKAASQKLLTQSGTLAEEIHNFLVKMRQGLFDRRRANDPDYKGPERRGERRNGSANMRRERVA